MRKLGQHPFNKYIRFQICPPFLPDESDRIHCPHCNKKALEYVDDWHAYDEHYNPTVYEIYSCRWCKSVFRRINHEAKSYLPVLR